ncbi:MAG: DUF58 domain-containing protein [Bacillus sp. (in: Bacteria)]|nr:DUF58 domain-containing protein [Bacillus sp. (in: firmicutes)]
MYPKTAHIARWEYIDSFHAYHRSSTAIFQRESTYIDGVKEYHAGEQLSRIHWNASAKTGEWKTKEFEREYHPKIVLLLDQYIHMYDNEDQFELAVSIFTSVINYLKEKGMSFQVISFDSNFFQVINGTRHSHHLDNYLLMSSHTGKVSLEKVIRDSRLPLDSGSVLVVVSPTISDNLVTTFSNLRKRNVHICHLWLPQTLEHQHVKTWMRSFTRKQVQLYPIMNLQELPDKLGGRV